MPNQAKERAAIHILDMTGNPGAAFYVRKAMKERDLLLGALKSVLKEYQSVDYLERMYTAPFDDALEVVSRIES